jgi:Alpha-galactosyl-binding fungal lectin
MNNRNLDENMEINERTPLIAIVQVVPLRQRYQHSVVQRFFTAALGSALIWVVFFVLPHRPIPIVDTQTCYSSLNTSRAYASAEALNNNINDFCQDVANNVPLITVGWTRSKTYYPNTPEEYTMTVVLSNRAFSSDQHQCTDAMSSIINGCDVPVGGSNSMNWKQGGKRVRGKYTYQIDISRQNRPWPPPAKPRQSCEGWYKFILQHYDIYGAGWANYDWGQRSLMPAINPCCGLGTSKSKIQNRIFLPC